MIFTIFLIAVLFGVVCLFLGYTQYSFPFAYLGMFVFLVLGIFLFSEGIDFDNGMQEVPFGSHNFVTVYENHTTESDFVVSILANVFFYIPLAGVLLTTFFALRGWK
jgi:hypothetical protein